MHKIRLLPRFQPLKAGESFSGYLLRRAQLNVYSCLHDITNVVGIRTSQDGLSSVQGSFEDLCKLLELDREDAINHFFWYTGERSRERTWLFGKVPLGAGLVDLKRPKVCPECLEEDEFIRAEWELTFFTACPRHGRPLVETCLHCGSRVGWGRQCIRRCKSCGNDFAPSIETATVAEVHLAQLMEDKLHGISQHFRPRTGEDLHSSLSLNGLSEITLFCGGLLAGLDRIDTARIATFSLAKRRGIMTLASSVINEGWPHGVHRLVDRFLSAEPLACRTARHLLPGLYEPLIRRYHREGFPFLLSKIGEYVSEGYPSLFAHWYGQSALVKETPGPLALESVTAFRERLRVSRSVFHRAAMSLESFQTSTVGGGSRRRLTRDEVVLLEGKLRGRRGDPTCAPLLAGGQKMSLKAFRAGEGFPFRDVEGVEGSACSINAISRRLGISDAAAMRMMDEVGAVRSQPEASGPQIRKEVSAVRYAEFEMGLCRYLPSSTSGNDGGLGIGIIRAVKDQLRRYDVSIGMLVNRILQGKVELVGIDSDRRGLDRLLVSRTDVSNLASSLRGVQSGSAVDAAGVKRLLQLPRVEVVYQLRKEGYIQGYQEGAKGGGRILFELPGIRVFHRRYVTLSEMMSLTRADVSSRSHGGVRKLLAAAGINPLFKVSTGGSSTPFYDRKSCEKVLTAI